jgi:hypothetical protein
MTVEQFMKRIKLFYGNHRNEYVNEHVKKYLIKEWIYRSEIEKLYKCLIRYYSSSYDKNLAPDIAIIEKVDKEFRIRQWGAGGDRIIPPGEKKPELQGPEGDEKEEDREDFCRAAREIFEDAKKKADERMEQIRKE